MVKAQDRSKQDGYFTEALLKKLRDNGHLEVRNMINARYVGAHKIYPFLLGKLLEP